MVYLVVYLLKVRKLIMSPIKDPRLELIIVMFIVPFFINVSTPTIKVENPVFFVELINNTIYTTTNKCDTLNSDL